LVKTGSDVMIGGFIIQGSGTKTVVVRAIGPALIPFGIPNALADPTLELHDGTGALIASNNNWQTTKIGGIITSNQVSAIQNSGHAPIQPRRVCDHCYASTGKLHRDREWCEQHRWSRPGGSGRSSTLLKATSEAHFVLMPNQPTVSGLELPLFL
jgi:hypothetical protein